MAEDDQEVENDDVENTEGEEGEGGDGDGESKGGGLDQKKLAILLIPVIVLLLGSGLYFLGVLDPLLGKKECVEEVDELGNVINECPKEESKDGEKGKDGEKEEKKDGKSAFLEIPTMIVNLNTEGGQPRYLRLTVQLELSSDKDKAAIEGVLPRVIDQFQTYLRELRVRDLRGSSGIYRLQTELLWRVNQAAAPTEVKDVLFQEILIQ